MSADLDKVTRLIARITSWAAATPDEMILRDKALARLNFAQEYLQLDPSDASYTENVKNLNIPILDNLAEDPVFCKLMDDLNAAILALQ